MDGPHFVYHWSGENRLIETTKEYDNLIAQGQWFDCPKKALTHKYLIENTMWTTRQASFLLCNQNPDPKTKALSPEADMIHSLIDQDFLTGKIKLKKRENIRGKEKYIAKNKDFIKWAIQRGLPISPLFLQHLELTAQNISPDTIETISVLGKKGSQKSNERHNYAKGVALEIAKTAWEKTPNKIKEDVVEIIKTEFHSKKILNINAPYSDRKISEWITEVIPTKNKKRGRPRTENKPT